MLSTLLYLINTLLGRQGASDIAIDFYGFRALVLHQDPYALLGPALQTMGVNWNVQHVSTHPPTAFLLTAPVAFLPFPIASALWGWLMIAATIASLRLYGLQWKLIVPIVVLLPFWSPFVYSLSQISALWLLGLAFAYHEKDKPLLAGGWIAFASLTKFLPALLLIPFILQKKWKAVIGFAGVWLIALILVTGLNPSAIPRYIQTNITTSVMIIERADNTSFLPSLLRWGGVASLIAGIFLLVIVAWYGRKEWQTWEFLAVALLPIAFIYSLLPLLPGAIVKRNWLIIGSLLLPFFIPPFGFIISVLLPPIIILLYSLGSIYNTAPAFARFRFKKIHL